MRVRACVWGVGGGWGLRHWGSCMVWGLGLGFLACGVGLRVWAGFTF